jgi:hypothetical protein
MPSLSNVRNGNKQIKAVAKPLGSLLRDAILQHVEYSKRWTGDGCHAFTEDVFAYPEVLNRVVRKVVV